MCKNLPTGDVSPKFFLFQFVIDRRGFEINGVESCEKCPPPGQVPKSCKHGFDPVFQELSGNCSCVTGYKCCGDKCPPLKNDCEKGTHFPQLIRDCYNCQKYVCRPCPVVDRKCLNPCDEPVDTKDERGCPSFECVRKPDPTYPIEVIRTFLFSLLFFLNDD